MLDAVEEGKWLTSSDISSILRDAHSVQQHWRSIDNALQAASDMAIRKKSSGRWQYRISASGKARLAADSMVRFLHPAKQLEAVRGVQDILSGLKNPIRICDPYLDYQTLHVLDAIATPASVSLLTRNVRDDGKLRAAYSAFNSNGRVLRIKTTNAALHDRYLIGASRILLLGCSLNGIGKSHSMIVEVGADVRDALSRTFEAIWSAGADWT